MNLESVREALLADAHREADALLAAAAADASARVDAAREEAEELVAAARADGEREAAALSAAELARARRNARETVLAAQREVYDEAVTAARNAATEYWRRADHTAIVAALTDRARAQLGPEVTVAVAETDGGIVATVGSRSVDYRLSAIADRCLMALGDEVRQLWR